jgi:hypothetical protein
VLYHELNKHIGEFMDMLNIAKEWVLARWAERTTWDGGVIVGLSLAWIILGDLIDWVAWIALLYGLFTFIKSENLDVWKK